MENIRKPENISPELKETLTNAKSIEELKDLAAKAGYELSDEALEGVSGGDGCESNAELREKPQCVIGFW